MPNRISVSFGNYPRLLSVGVALLLVLHSKADAEAQKIDGRVLLAQAQSQTETSTTAETPTETTSENPEAEKADSEAKDNAAPSITGDGPQVSPDPVSESWAKANFTSFIDRRQRLKQPDQALLEKGLRILTSDDYPPFNSRDAEERPRGYHVEMARMLCDELNTACTLKFVEFAKIPELLANGDADVAMAGLAKHPSLRKTLGFSLAYLQRPGRFVANRSVDLKVDPQSLAGKPIAVQGQSAHEAYIKAYFPDVSRVPVADMKLAQQLLQQNRVVGIFGDAFQLAEMVSPKDSKMGFVGGPYYDSHFFGEGMAIAYDRKQKGLGEMLDYGLLRLAQKGRLAELYSRHFAINVYAKGR